MKLSVVLILLLAIVTGLVVYAFNSESSQPDYMYRPNFYVADAMQRLAKKGSFAFEVGSSVRSPGTNIPALHLTGWWSKKDGFYVEERHGQSWRQLSGAYLLTPDGRMAVMTDGTWSLGNTSNDTIFDYASRHPIQGGTWAWVDEKTAQDKAKFLHDLFLGPFDDVFERIGFGIMYNDTHEHEGMKSHSITAYVSNPDNIAIPNRTKPFTEFTYNFSIDAKTRLPRSVGAAYTFDTGNGRHFHGVSARYFNIGEKVIFPRVAGEK